MKFEWDEAKNESNLEKHGLDFEDAAKLFDGPILVTLDTGQDYGEERWLGLGLIEHRAVVAAYTYRGSETVRIISMRKALPHETLRYQQFLQDQLGSN